MGSKLVWGLEEVVQQVDQPGIVPHMIMRALPGIIPMHKALSTAGCDGNEKVLNWKIEH